MNTRIGWLVGGMVLWALAGRAGAAGKVVVECDRGVPQIAFAAGEIERAAESAKGAVVVAIEIGAAGLAQGYRIEREGEAKIRVVGGDAVGAMYGGLDVAEAVKLGVVGELTSGEHRPYIARRGIKFNIPLDLRTPSYSDNGDSFQANIPQMWSMEFWRELLDEMARQRYNVLSLWNLHPFPSIVKVPEYPDVALNDVWRTRVKLDETFSLSGNDMVRPGMLKDVEIVKKLSIDEKIRFWREVMQYAKGRGIDVYWFTWNIFAWAAEGKYGITIDRNNPATIAYFRASVRETVRTYPLLGGMGITAGEQMGSDKGGITKEQWLWRTYGEGIRDALKQEPGREFRLIHRFHQTGQGEILREFKEYPGPFDFSFKYSVAHMHSMTNPPFIKPVLAQMPTGMRTWLTVRNDDIYSFRWGDPDYARDYVKAMPRADRLAGYYMGPDGYCWGREFIDREPETPRQLVMKKQWYSFMLWGRLSYEPGLGNAHFERVLGARFPEVESRKLYQAWSGASKIVPQATRFFWGDIDLLWFPEACTRHPAPRGFYTVKDFILGSSMPESGVLNIRQWRDRLSRGVEMGGMTPLEVAEALRGHAGETLGIIKELRASQGGNKELRMTLSDLEAMSHLGNYYAAKILGATDLAVFDQSGKEELRQSAVSHLEAALTHWKKYATVATGQYRPQLLNRIGYVDLNALVAKVQEDVAMARDWRIGSLPGSALKPAQVDTPFRP